MTYQPITRPGIERAEPLEFVARQPARTDLAFTIKVLIDGFLVEAGFTGSIAELHTTLKQLRQQGAQPTIAPAASPARISAPKHAKAERVEPFYTSDGVPCCPQHRKPLQESQHGGWFCSSKARPGEPQNSRGYCSLHFAD